MKASAYRRDVYEDVRNDLVRLIYNQVQQRIDRDSNSESTRILLEKSSELERFTKRDEHNEELMVRFSYGVECMRVFVSQCCCEIVRRCEITISISNMAGTSGNILFDRLMADLVWIFGRVFPLSCETNSSITQNTSIWTHSLQFISEGSRDKT